MSITQKLKVAISQYDIINDVKDYYEWEGWRVCGNLIELIYNDVVISIVFAGNSITVCYYDDSKSVVQQLNNSKRLITVNCTANELIRDINNILLFLARN